MSAVFPPRLRGADGTNAGSAGLVPPPAATDNTKFLRGDGSFQTIAGGGDMLAANNLGDVASAATSRSNLGLGAASAVSFGSLSCAGQIKSDAATPEFRATASTTTTPFGYTFYNGSDYDASIRHQVNTGTLTIDAGRSSSWGAEIDLYVDTVRSARFSKTATTFDQNVSISGTLTIATATPASAGAAGVAGTIAWDASYVYICVATNTWRRVAHSTW